MLFRERKCVILVCIPVLCFLRCFFFLEYGSNSNLSRRHRRRVAVVEYIYIIVDIEMKNEENYDESIPLFLVKTDYVEKVPPCLLVTAGR